MRVQRPVRADIVNVAIRQGLPAELRAIVAIDEFASAHRERADFIAESIARGECLIAQIDAEIGGFIVLNYSFYGFGFIPLLVVSPLHRRRGIARRLLSEAQLRCTSRKLFTSANASNTAALALFASAGFTRSGIIENLDDGDPEVVMFLRSGLA